MVREKLVLEFYFVTVQTGLELVILLSQLPLSVVGVTCGRHSTLQLSNVKSKCLSESVDVVENIHLSKTLKKVRVFILGTRKQRNLRG